MATTVAQIADGAIAKVNAAITDAILIVNLWSITEGTYSAVTGSRPPAETDLGAFSMVVQTEKPISDLFPDYVAGPGDQLVFLRGNTVPQEGWELRGANTHTIMKVQDLVGNGTIFNAVVR